MAEKVDKSDLGKVISERKSRKKGKTECPGYILQKRTLSTSDKRGSRDIFVNNQTSLKVPRFHAIHNLHVLITIEIYETNLCLL